MAKTEALKNPGFGKTSRRDAWWLTPAATFIVLSTFIVYATWAAFQNANYSYGNYLSPFYSPEIFGSSPHSIFGPKPGWWPGWLPFIPQPPPFQGLRVSPPALNDRWPSER